MANCQCPLREAIAKVKVKGILRTLLVMERRGEHHCVSGKGQPDFMNDTGKEGGRWEGGEEAENIQVFSTVTNK